MTVTVTDIVAGPFTATGAEMVLLFEFLVFTEGEVEIVHGADRTVVDPNLYTVEMNKAVDGQAMEGGEVTLSAEALDAGTEFRLVAKPFKTQELVFSDTGSRLRNLNEVADRAALRALRAQYDGALEGAGQELIEAAAEAGAAAGAAASADKADRTGGNLTDNDAQSFGETLGVYAIPVERFGAVAGTLVVDNTDAINDAEAAAAILGVSVTFREGAEYFFQGTLLARRSRLTWRGARSRLTYCGANTTRNLLELGDGTNVYREQIIVGLEICSRTIMTGGWAVWAPKVVRSTHWFDNLQGQDFCEENVARGINPSFYGITLWGGYWADRVDNVKMFADAINAQHTGWKVNGAIGSPQADFWPVVGKVSWAEVGGHMAGGFGGLYLTPNTTLIHNKINLLVDQSHIAEPNRELFATGTIFDVAEGNNLGVHANVVINDPGGLRINFTGCWFSAGQSHGIWTKAHQGVMTISGCRIIQMVGDGFRTSQADTGFTLITGCQITSNGGWGINGLVDNYAVSYGANDIGGNTAGEVNPAKIVRPASMTLNGAAKFLGIVEGVQFQLDANSAWRFVLGNPRFQSDIGDYYGFDRTLNKHIWAIGGQEALTAKPGYVSMIDSGYYAPGARLTGTANGSGLALANHSDASLPRKIKNVQGFYYAADGSSWHIPGAANITTGYIAFSAYAPAANRPFVITYEYFETPW